jgi:sigma-B regulation protein RsbU (phosphoserine phosphatase)
MAAPLDPASGALRSLNAGHNPGLLVPAEGEIVELTAGGMPLGLRTGASYDSFRLQMDGGGDLLCLYSDGITECEAPDEEEFGLDRLRDLLCENSELPLPEILENIEATTTAFATGQPQGDDQTVVLLRRSA